MQKQISELKRWNNQKESELGPQEENIAPNQKLA